MLHLFLLYMKKYKTVCKVKVKNKKQKPTLSASLLVVICVPPDILQICAELLYCSFSLLCPDILNIKSENPTSLSFINASKRNPHPNLGCSGLQSKVFDLVFFLKKYSFTPIIFSFHYFRMLVSLSFVILDFGIVSTRVFLCVLS